MSDNPLREEQRHDERDVRDERRVRDARGASAVEYGLLVAGIAALIVIVVFALGDGVLNELFTRTCQSIGANMEADC